MSACFRLVKPASHCSVHLNYSKSLFLRRPVRTLYCVKAGMISACRGPAPFAKFRNEPPVIGSQSNEGMDFLRAS